MVILMMPRTSRCGGQAELAKDETIVSRVPGLCLLGRLAVTGSFETARGESWTKDQLRRDMIGNRCAPESHYF
jgi:hypothetical protein